MLSLLRGSLFHEPQTVNQNSKFRDDRRRLYVEEAAARVENPIELRLERVQIGAAQTKSLSYQTFGPVTCHGMTGHLTRGRDAQTVSSELVRQNKDRHQTTIEAPPILVNRAEFRGIP